MWRTLAIVGAVFFHGVVLLFGGVLLPGNQDTTMHEEVELLAPEEAKKDQPVPEPPEKPPEVQPEKPPDASEILKSLDTRMPSDAPALDAASLSALEQALSGGGAGGWGGGADIATSGGSLSGTGKGKGGDGFDGVMEMAEIDQKPHAVYQMAPFYPSEMRGKKVEGLVSIVFVVNADGRVQDPRVEKSNHPAFEKPALDAIKQWRFEAAVKGGKRVPCRMRAPIRFQAS